MAIAAGIVCLRGRGAAPLSRSVRITGALRSLERAAHAHLADTGTLPREYCDREGAEAHLLTRDPGSPGWSGPYLAGPLDRSWNPCGGQVHVFDRVVPAYAGGDGFDLDGDGVPDVDGNRGCIATFWGVDPATAKSVDRAIDASWPGPGLDSGRVEYQAARGRLTVLLVHLDAARE